MKLKFFGVFVALLGINLLALTPVSAQVNHEEDRDLSTPIVFFDQIEVSGDGMSTPTSAFVDGERDPFVSYWACVPEGLTVSARASVTIDGLETESFEQLGSSLGFGESGSCANGELTDAVFVGFASFVELRVDAGNTALLPEVALFGRSARDLDDPDAIAGRMAESQVSIVDGDLEIITREGWGADESLRDLTRDDPPADRADHIIIHHTATPNDYTATEAADIVNSIYVFHTSPLGQGWNDCGFHFIVDKFGQVFECRAGGLGTNNGQGFILTAPSSTGIHNRGFNTGSKAIALLGTHTSAELDEGEVDGEPVSEAAIESLLDLTTVIAGVDRINLNEAIERPCIIVVQGCNDGGSIILPTLTQPRRFVPTASPGGFAIQQLFGDAAVQDFEVGTLPTPERGSLRDLYNAQSTEERLAWAQQAIDFSLENDGNSPSSQDEIREAQLDLVELQRLEAEVERLLIEAERLMIAAER